MHRFLSTRASRLAAFTRAELLCLTAMLALVGGAFAPSLFAQRLAQHRIQCLGNLGRIASAISLYANEHRGYCPHPSWGAGLTGPENWAYATANRGRIPGAPTLPPDLQGRGTEHALYATQVEFMKLGQLYPYLNTPHVFVCATDREQAQAGTGLRNFLGRSVKVTSYTMNATSARLQFNERKRLLSDAPPEGIAFWETNESTAFAFNDAANNPEVISEGLTQRHDGGGTLGRFDGAAEYVPWRRFASWQSQRHKKLLLEFGK